MKLFNNLKKGWKYMAMGFEQSELSEERINKIVSDWESSDQLKWMLAGERYYRVDNDYLTATTDYQANYQADNRLIHAKYKNLVDEKIGFKFSKDAVLTSKDEKYLKLVQDTLGKYFNYHLESLGYQASNKGIAWLHPYVADDQFKLFVVPSEQCIPVWSDASHEHLDAFIRCYSFKVWRFGREVEIKRVEVWDDQGARFYRKDGGVLIRESELDREGHFFVDEEPTSWGRIPFIAFKNNRVEIPDIKLVKHLLDAYDKSRSETANYIDETKNVVYVLKGYGGTSATEFRLQINRDRVILLDADDGDDKSSAETLTPKIDITAVREHYEQLARDIVESGQGVHRDIDKFGNAPSGVALQFLFNNLELKGNALESEFRKSFDYLMNFVNKFLEIKQTGFKPADADLVFNDDMAIDEEGVIKQCLDSVEIISRKTIIANHPWVKDVEDEIKQKKLEEEEESESIDYNPAPVEEADDNAEQS